MRFTTLPREIMLRRTEDTQKLPENYPKSWKALTKKIKQTPSKKAQSLADLGKREKEFTANIDLIKKFNPRLKNDRLTLPSPLKQTLIKKSSCQKSSCSYENHQGYQIVFTKNKVGQLVAHIKDKISQGTIVDKKTGKSAKEIPVMVDEGIKDPLAFLVEATHRGDTYRACFYPGYESQDPTVVVGFNAAGLKGGGVINFNNPRLSNGLQRELTIQNSLVDLKNDFEDFKEQITRIDETLKELINDLGKLEEKLAYTHHKNAALEIKSTSKLLLKWSQDNLDKLEQPDTKAVELIENILNDTLHQLIPELSGDQPGSPGDGEIYIRIKFFVDKVKNLLKSMTESELEARRESLEKYQSNEDIYESTNLITNLIAISMELIPNMVNSLKTIVPSLYQNQTTNNPAVQIISSQCDRNINDLQDIIEQFTTIIEKRAYKGHCDMHCIIS